MTPFGRRRRRRRRRRSDYSSSPGRTLGRNRLFLLERRRGRTRRGASRGGRQNATQRLRGCHRRDSYRNTINALSANNNNNNVAQRERASNDEFCRSLFSFLVSPRVRARASSLPENQPKGPRRFLSVCFFGCSEKSEHTLKKALKSPIKISLSSYLFLLVLF